LIERLTRRANQGHIGIIAGIVKPAPETGSGFFILEDDRPKQFCRNCSVALYAI
jgi:hypothetical protein